MNCLSICHVTLLSLFVFRLKVKQVEGLIYALFSDTIITPPTFICVVSSRINQGEVDTSTSIHIVFLIFTSIGLFLMLMLILA